MFSPAKVYAITLAIFVLPPIEALFKTVALTSTILLFPAERLPVLNVVGDAVNPSGNISVIVTS